MGEYSKYITSINLARNSTCKSAIKTSICIVSEKNDENIRRQRSGQYDFLSLLTTERLYYVVLTKTHEYLGHGTFSAEYILLNINKYNKTMFFEDITEI